MRKTITILLLIVLLSSGLSSCKKEKKNFVTPQNKILFTAKKKGYTNIVKLDTKTKTKQIISSFPLLPDKIEISTDNKKIAFSVKTIKDERNGIESYDIYTMNPDGSDQALISKTIDLTLSQYDSLDFTFTPDNQEILLSIHYSELIETNNVKGKNKTYLFSLDGKKVERIDETKTESLLLTKSIEVMNWEGKSNQNTLEYLLYDNKTIGIFSWKTKTFSPIIEYPGLINDFSWSPDQKSILFSVKIREEKVKEDGEIQKYSYFDVYLFDTIKKTTKKIIANSKVNFQSFIWLADHINLLYTFDDKITTYPIHHVILVKLNLNTLEKTNLFSPRLNGFFNYISDQKLLCCDFGIDGGIYYILDLVTNKIEKYPGSEEVNHCQGPFIHNKNLIVLSEKSLLIFNTDTNQTLSKFNITDKSEDGNHRPHDFTFSPDQSSFYFVHLNKIYIFDILGKLIHIETLSLSSFEYTSEGSSFMTGAFTSPSEITYLEYVNEGSDMSDLYQNDFTSKKITNLTEKVGDLLDYQVSPDQQSVAFLTREFEKNLREVSVMNLSSTTESSSKIIKITSFKPLTDEREEQYSELNSLDEPKLLSMLWSTDSQQLYFTSNKVQESDVTDEANNIPYFKKNLLSIQKVNKDGTDLTVLSDPDHRSFFPALSPDNKQMVFVANEHQLIKQMNSDGSNLHTCYETDPSSSRYNDIYFQPRWLLDDKTIFFILQASHEKKFKLMFLDNQEKLILSKDIVVQDRTDYPQYKLYKAFDMNHFCSPNKHLVAYHSRIDLKLNQYQAVLLKDLKEEIPLKGNIVSFRWSPTGNQLLLLESKEKDQINQLTLYDTSSNTYTSISQDVQQLFDACWSPDGKQILYAGTDSKFGKIVFKTSQADGSNQKLLFIFGENPLEKPNSIEKIEKLVWLK
jgi:Tol biopolymer transport system component